MKPMNGAGTPALAPALGSLVRKQTAALTASAGCRANTVESIEQIYRMGWKGTFSRILDQIGQDLGKPLQREEVQHDL
ncbi:hypothetical protein [Thioalkalivibrio sp.]|uniref:hypothetical protein n=1 Tax=Thioalkalivibrio sp. TaxID=2093813 RepID=UPI00356A6AEA